MRINPLDLIFWRYRRSPGDVTRLYDATSGIMRAATGGDWLNFGLWDDTHDTPQSAQQNLCDTVSEMAGMKGSHAVLDVGSGLGRPAARWAQTKKPAHISCVNTSMAQLRQSKAGPDISRVNASATSLPFAPASADCIVSLESAQHFNPLDRFVSDSYDILRPGGVLAMALPVACRRLPANIVSVTWTSEHYTRRFVTDAVSACGFEMLDDILVGGRVYCPLADYYMQNRSAIRQAVCAAYPGYVESIVYRSIKGMNKLSQDGIIDYLIVVAAKNGS